MFRLFTLPFRLFFSLFGAVGPVLAFVFALLPFAIYLTLGTICVKYDIAVLLHHTLPTFWALLIALIVGPVAITAAIVAKILTIAGVLPALLAL